MTCWARDLNRQNISGWLKYSGWRHAIAWFAIAIAIFVPFWLLFSTFFYELRSIPSESMVPALQVGDRVAVAKFAYGYNRNSIPFGLGLMVIGDDPKNSEERIMGSNPHRGDVIVFQHPHSDRVMIKRLVGLPGGEGNSDGTIPFAEMTWARPSRRCAVRPGRRASDSAIEVSGSLPMSSAEMASTIEVDVFFKAIEFSIPARMPVTTISSTAVVSSAGLGVVSWAWAMPAEANMSARLVAAPPINRARRC